MFIQNIYELPRWNYTGMDCVWTALPLNYSDFHELLYPSVHTFHLYPSIHSSIYLSINRSISRWINQSIISIDLLYQIVCPSIRLSLLSREHIISRYILCMRVCSMMYLAKQKVVRSDRLAFYCAEFDVKRRRLEPNFYRKGPMFSRTKWIFEMMF